MHTYRPDKLIQFTNFLFNICATVANPETVSELSLFQCYFNSSLHCMNLLTSVWRMDWHCDEATKWLGSCSNNLCPLGGEAHRPSKTEWLPVRLIRLEWTRLECGLRTDISWAKLNGRVVDGCVDTYFSLSVTNEVFFLTYSKTESKWAPNFVSWIIRIFVALLRNQRCRPGLTGRVIFVATAVIELKK